MGGRSSACDRRPANAHTRAHADAGTDAKRHDHELNGECQRQGVDCLVAHIGDRRIGDAGDEERIDDVIKRLSEHREHHGKPHIQHQLRDRHGAHFVVFFVSIFTQAALSVSSPA